LRFAKLLEVGFSQPDVLRVGARIIDAGESINHSAGVGRAVFPRAEIEQAVQKLIVAFDSRVPHHPEEIAALKLAGGANFLSVIDAHQRDALAYLFLNLHDDGNMVAQIFWGLWLFPFGICVLRSGFIPRFLGILLIIAAPGYLASSFGALVLPQYAPAIDKVARILTLAELPIIFWLLIWGAKDHPVDQPHPDPAIA
jgi:hypothetical protein